jgi:hypothetical protein
MPGATGGIIILNKSTIGVQCGREVRDTAVNDRRHDRDRGLDMPVDADGRVRREWLNESADAW